LVTLEVRSSERLKVRHQGFKSSSCVGNSCICCNTIPPTLSKKVIKCLGNEFCNIPVSMLDDEARIRKYVTSKTVVPRAKQSEKDKGKFKKEDEYKTKKKNKKL
jgi:hypothetical protein